MDRQARATRISRIQLATLLAASSLTIMAGSVVAPALPAMREHYATLHDVGVLVALVLTLPGLVIAVLSPFMGLIADLFGRTRLLVIGLALFVVSGGSGFIVDSLPAILLGRGFMGVAVACVMTAASALLVDMTEGMARHVVIGQQAAATGLGGLVFPLLSGVLVQHDWRIAFLSYLLPIILLPIALLKVKDVPTAPHASVTPLAEFPIARGVITYALAFLGMVILYAIPLKIPSVLTSIGHPSPIASGFAIGIASLSAAACSLLYGTLRARFSPVALIALSFGIVTIGYLVVSQSTEIVATTIGLVMAGAGFGINLPNLTSWLMVSMPFGLRGRAAGGLTSAISLGQFVSTFVSAAVVSEQAGSSSFQLVSVVCALVSGAAVLSLFARRAVSAVHS